MTIEMEQVKCGDALSQKQKILRSALELFCLHPFAKVSIRQICAKANCNVGAVNYHFRDKAGLYRACFEYLSTLTPTLGVNLRLERAPQDVLADLFDLVLAPLAAHKNCTENPALAWSKLNAQEEFCPTGLVDDIKQTFSKSFHEIFKAYLSHHTGLGTTDARLTLLTFSLIGGGVFLTLRWDLYQYLVQAEPALSITQIKTELIEHACRLIRSYTNEPVAAVAGGAGND